MVREPTKPLVTTLETVDCHEMQSGDRVTVAGQTGAFTFWRARRNRVTGAAWVDVTEGIGDGPRRVRSFALGDVHKIPAKKRRNK